VAVEEGQHMMMDPKVTVSVPGRFHAFDLASQLHKRGMLRRLITTYPAFKAMEWGLPRDRICSILPVEVLKRLWGRLPAPIGSHSAVRDAFDKSFEEMAARRIPTDTDIFVGWSGSALAGIRRVRKRGGVTIVERGSSHIQTQTELLLKEHRLHGGTPHVASQHTTRTETAEYAEADYISVPSEFARRSFVDRGVPGRKVLHIPYGVDLSMFHPEPKCDNVFRIVHCGGISFRKGVHHLLRAFAELDLPNAELWLIGAVAPELDDYRRRHPFRGVTLRGTFAQSQLCRELSKASVFALASIEEGLALVIPQAMACGLPVVCSGSTGGADVVRHGVDGFVFNAGDVGALKGHLRWCYEHQDRLAEMGRAARERVTAGFSWDDYGDRIETVYRNVLAQCQHSAGAHEEKQ
jgi:glycosyltransferase involved in cell wall biosynthesis